jgi:predicted DNA-binding mobile mystery protein A
MVSTILGRRFTDFGSPSRFTPPVKGWIRAVRESLGMSSAQLGHRLGIKQPSVVAMEQSEMRASIELATLRRVAEAMNCTLVYALIPNEPLEKIVRDRSLAVARARLEAVDQSMLLENQKTDEKNFGIQLEELVRELNPRRLWD